MKTKMIFWGVMLLLLATSCDKNDEAFPTDKDRDWFEMKDDPNNPLPHSIYAIYKETGISIYYNDTIGWEDRGIDLNGNPLIHYEILDPFYTLASNSSGKDATFVLHRDEENIMGTVILLKETVIARLPEYMYPRSLLIVDSLQTTDYTPRPLIIRKGLMTSLVQVIIEQTEEEKVVWGANIASTLVANYLMDTPNEKFNAFFDVSGKVLEGGISAYKVDMMMGMPNFVEDIGLLGFLVYSAEKDSYPPYMYYTPDQKEDLRSYLAAYYQYTDQEFKAEYGDYPLVIKKYEMIREIVNQL